MKVCGYFDIDDNSIVLSRSLSFSDSESEDSSFGLACLFGELIEGVFLPREPFDFFLCIGERSVILIGDFSFMLPRRDLLGDGLALALFPSRLSSSFLF